VLLEREGTVKNHKFTTFHQVPEAEAIDAEAVVLVEGVPVASPRGS
jgi:hypothetical protein